MDSVTIFNRCPKYDDELRNWSLVNKELEEEFSKEKKEYWSCLKELANQCNRDSTDGTVIEYGFSIDAIKEIVNIYKEEDWDVTNIVEDIKRIRDTSNEENYYINNIIKPWTRYNVPAINTKEHYEMREYGILRYVESVSESGEPQHYNKEVCRTPFVICGISDPLGEDELYYKIRTVDYKGDIKEFWGGQSELLSRKELKTLFLSKGINCPENSILNETIEYISRSISEFGPRLKKEHSTKQCGWNESKSIFVIGNRAISSKGIEPILSVGKGKGFQELEKRGTLEGWMKGTQEIFEYDLIRFKCYDALTAPLNSILGLESHVTDHYGNTSCGKTFSSWVALSTVGDPEGLTIGAKGSMKGILVTIRDFSDLPLLIDESSDAGEHLKDLVYPLTSNKGRVTSTQDKQRDGGEEFHTSTMFTGERMIRDCLPNSGQQYRVNELDDTLPDLPTKKIMNIKQAIRDNHGHIIELYIQKLFEWRESGFLQDTYDACFDSLPENTSNIEGRSRAIFAGIMTAGNILESVFGDIGYPQKRTSKIVKKYYKKCIQDKPIELEYIRALRVILDWAHSDYGKFTQIIREIKEFEEFEYNTTIDKNQRYGYIDDDYIDIIQTEFTKKMKKEGYSPSKIKEDLFKQGISLSNDSKRPGVYRTSRKGFGSYVCIRVIRSIAEEVTGYVISDTQKKEEVGRSQEEKIGFIFETIRLLTKIHGAAEIKLMRQILDFNDLDDLLSILTCNGKILKPNQTTYKIV